MMNEASQEQAALHALGILGPEAAARVEVELARDPELFAYARELEEAAAGGLARSFPLAAPPERLRARVLGEIALNADAPAAPRAAEAPARGKIVAFPQLAWAAAAVLLLCCGLLALDRVRMERRMEALRRSDNLSRLQLYALLNVPGGPAATRASVAYDVERQEGVLEVEQLPPRPPGKDYQLWSLEAGEADTMKAISNGVVRADANGRARLRFRPAKTPERPLSLFAIALEEEGGVAVHVGPVVMKARARGD